MSYDPMNHFAAPAAARSEWWRLGVGVVAVSVLSIIFLIIFALAIPSYEELGPIGIVIFDILAIGTTGLALRVVLRRLHGRSLRSAIGPLNQAIPDFVLVAKAIFIVAGIELLIWLALGHPDGERSTLGLGRWLVALPFVASALVIQTGAEEMLFRGYLQQQIAVRRVAPVWWMLGPSVLFGLLHYWNDVGAAAWLYVVLAGASGLSWADLTARTGNLGAAWGAHFAQNLMSFSVYSRADGSEGASLYVLSYDETGQVAGLDLINGLLWVLITWLAARLALARRAAERAG